MSRPAGSSRVVQNSSSSVRSKSPQLARKIFGSILYSGMVLNYFLPKFCFDYMSVKILVRVS